MIRRKLHLSLIILLVESARCKNDIFEDNTSSSLSTSSSNIKSRIVGGSDVPVNEYPWFASGIETSGRRGCGGMLVAPEYVLTAAHCFESEWASFEIGALCTNNDNNCNQQMEVISVGSYTLHPDWKPEGGDGDYALVRLVRASSITPVLMDTGTVSSTYIGGENVWVAGFGTTDALIPTIPTHLQHVEISIIPPNICQQFRPITDNMICAADPGENSCNGDSGGPLYDKTNGVLIGVVSSGPQPCAPEDGPPGIYSKVASQYNWIESTICSDHNEPKPNFCDSSPTPMLPTPTPSLHTPLMPSPAPQNPSAKGTFKVEVQNDANSHGLILFVQRKTKKEKWSKRKILKKKFDAREFWIREKQLNKVKCYRFKIIDKNQDDGICCLHGPGYYKIYWEGNLLKESKFYGPKPEKEIFGAC